MMSSDDREIIINDIIKAMNASFDARFEQMEASMNQRFAEVNAKLDGNTVEMKERFAAVDERLIKTEAIMDSTKEHIVLVERNMNERLTLVKDEVSADIKSQIGEARAEFQEVITVTNERVVTLGETMDKQLDDMKTTTNIRMLESDTKVDNLTKSVATVTSKLDTYILREMPAEVRALTRPAMDNLYLDMDRVVVAYGYAT